MVLTCALGVGADYIVSKDHRLEKLRGSCGIKIRSSNDFLEEGSHNLGRSQPDEAVHREAETDHLGLLSGPLPAREDLPRQTSRGG